MHTFQKIAVALVGGVAIGLGLAVGLLLCGTRMMCGNDVLAEVRSPSGAEKAVVFQRDCGATTGFSTQVSILPAEEKLPNRAGNIFSADTDHGRAPRGPGGGPELEVRWISEDALRIQHHPQVRVFKAESVWDGIDVLYDSSAHEPS